jgi:hypothetical protein
MAPPKSLSFKEGVLLVEDVKASKNECSMEKMLEKFEDDTHRYRTIVEHNLNAHFHMGLDLEKKVAASEGRIKDLEDKRVYYLAQLVRFQALMWDMENQNCEYEDCFKKNAEVALTKWNDPPISFHNGRPYPWKLKKWEAHYKEDNVSQEGHATTI